MLKEESADINNTTFTLVSSHKPVKLLSEFKDNCKKVKKGLYLIEKVNILPIWVVVIEELEFSMEKEIALLKEFSYGKDLDNYLRELLLNLSKKTTRDYKGLFDYALLMYQYKMNKIANKENIQMTIMEKNSYIIAQKLGMYDKLIDEGREKGREEGLEEGREEGEERNNIETARKMKKRGMDITIIRDITGLSTAKINKIK